MRRLIRWLLKDVLADTAALKQQVSQMHADVIRFDAAMRVRLDRVSKPETTKPANPDDSEIDYSGERITPRMQKLVPGLTPEMAKLLDWRRLE